MAEVGKGPHIIYTTLQSLFDCPFTLPKDFKVAFIIDEAHRTFVCWFPYFWIILKQGCFHLCIMETWNPQFIFTFTGTPSRKLILGFGEPDHRIKEGLRWWHPFWNYPIDKAEKEEIVSKFPNFRKIAECTTAHEGLNILIEELEKRRPTAKAFLVVPSKEALLELALMLRENPPVHQKKKKDPYSLVLRI
jgi:hypothetical protein